jgi:hypothetical protein
MYLLTLARRRQFEAQLRVQYARQQEEEKRRWEEQQRRDVCHPYLLLILINIGRRAQEKGRRRAKTS